MHFKALTILVLYMGTLLAACGGKNVTPDTPEQQKTLSAPTGVSLASEADTSSLSFKWNAVDGASQYRYRLLKGNTEDKTGTVSSTSVTFNGLTPSTTYKFDVAAVSGSVESGWSTRIEATTATPVAPGVDPAARYAEMQIPACEEDGTVRAFPGAEGGGMFATGGRGGSVIHVTNLNDSGTGSLRQALCKTKGKRTIVFDVAGIIELQSSLVINSDYGDVTVAGQTAPGDGICLKNYTLRINASNVIIRFVRCRMGDEAKTEDDAMDLYTHDNNISNVIIDHCSLSWSTDECGSFYGVTGFTLQWCILSESLRNSIHDKGKHGYGGIWGGSDAAYHHNLLAHHDSRNPRFDHDYVSTLKGPVSFINNVVYNWGDNSTYGGESANTTGTYKMYNMVGNYYKPGPATASGKHRFIDPTTSCSNCTSAESCSTIVPGHFYMTGNVMDGDEGKTSDNWTATTASSDLITAIKSASVFKGTAGGKISQQSAQDAYAMVLKYAGASLSRDKVDRRIASETENGTYTYKGSNGSDKGFIDSQSDVEGWPAYSATAEQEASVKDTDGDGMPDWFEEQFGLDKSSSGDGAAFTIDTKGRYTNLEMYMHYLVRDIVTAQNAKSTYIEY